MTCGEPKTVTGVIAGPQHLSCRLDGGSTMDLPLFLGRFIRRTDVLRPIPPGGGALLIDRPSPQARSQCLLYSTIGYVTQPRISESGAEFRVCAELPNSSGGLDALFLSGDAIRRYFYGLDDDRLPKTLYDLLCASESATLGDLRMAWRVRQLESGLTTVDPAERARVERAFNVLAHPDLRNCYDALRRNDDAPPLFPYGGFGSILVEGNLSRDAGAFFAHRILAYKPEMSSRKVSLLLRQCEFFADRVICMDRRRKLEVWLDSNLLPGIQWDLTWNHWKHWLRSRIEVVATFVHAGKYRLQKGEWILRNWHVALPSRLRVTVPEGITKDVERAKAIHALLGQHTDALGKIRAEIEKQPVEHVQIQEWFDRLGASPHLRPQHVTWRPDYEPYYFEQLQKHSLTWFLFREEYLFLWPHVLISEVPQPGHATYVFAKPADVGEFMKRYSHATREDVRHNRNNTGGDLEFVGRVVRGRKKKRWLADLLKLAGEKADYVEVFE